MLVIRTGRADETLPTAGVTHLVEHLALPATSRRTLEFQGSVDNILTQFVATGDPAKVGAFLTQTAEQLRSLPRERLESERRILLAEEATQPYSAVRLAYALRFGPAGQGLTGYDEWGLRRLSADDVQAWSNGRFVSGNAALWLTGAPPDELAPVLPDGGAVLAPEPKDLDDLRLPALSREGADGSFLLSLVAERSHAFKLALGVLEHRLRDHLRYRLGLTYGVEVVFMPMTATSVHVAVIADAAGRRRRAPSRKRGRSLPTSPRTAQPSRSSSTSGSRRVSRQATRTTSPACTTRPCSCSSGRRTSLSRSGWPPGRP